MKRIVYSLTYTNALSAVNEDKEGKYVLENNGDFLEETDVEDI